MDIYTWVYVARLGLKGQRAPLKQVEETMVGLLEFWTILLLSIGPLRISVTSQLTILRRRIDLQPPQKVIGEKT